MGVNRELRKFIPTTGRSAADGQPVRLSQQRCFQPSLRMVESSVEKLAENRKKPGN